MANLSNINGKFVVEQTTGYVGVGTTDPNYPIEVLNASAEIALNASGASIYRLKSDSTDAFRINKNGVGDRLIIAGNGNATFSGSINAGGSPSITPNTNFDTLVVTESAHSGITILSGNTSDGAIYFGDPDFNGAGQIKYLHASNSMTFTTDNDNPTLTLDDGVNATFAGQVNAEEALFNGKLKIYDDGTLNWGAAQDSGRLTYDTGVAIVAGLSGKSLVLRSGGSGSSNTALTLDTSQNATFAGSITVGTGNSVINGDLYFGVNADIFKSSGTLGINAANSNFSGNIILNNNNELQSKDTAGNANRIMYLDNGDTLVIGNPTTVDDIRFDVDTFGEGAMIIKSSGNVGIGVTNPAAKLQVEGTGDLVRLVSTNDGVGGAQMDMLQFSTSPADNDIMGLINMGGYYSGTSSAYFSSIRTIATDVSARKGALSFFTRSEGSFTEKMRITSGGNVGINTTLPSTKLSINDANYVEMATFTAASGSTAGIVANNSGYVTGFTTSATHQSSNTALFVPVTDGIKITKAGLLQITTTQDFRSTTAANYAQVVIYKNSTIMFYSLRTNSNSQWDMLNSSGTMIVAANDVIKVRYAAGDFLSMDTGAWSQYSFVWTSR